MKKIGLYVLVAIFSITSVKAALPILFNRNVEFAKNVTGLQVVGNVANGTVDSGNPIKAGFKAVNHSLGGNTTLAGVGIGDRTDWVSNVDGVPFMMGGHPNVKSVRTNYTAAQTDQTVVTIDATDKIIVTECTVTADNNNSVDVLVRLGFGASATPTGDGVFLSHPGIAAGSSVVEGNGAGILGVGGLGEDIFITSQVPTSGSIDVVITYYSVTN